MPKVSTYNVVVIDAVGGDGGIDDELALVEENGMVGELSENR